MPSFPTSSDSTLNPEGEGNVSEEQVKAANILWNEKEQYERASQPIRQMILDSYRNYYGEFDEPTTRFTKREKIFMPLTKELTNTVASQIYVTPEAVNILPRTEDDVKKARIWHELLQFQLDKMNLDAAMVNMVQNTALLGTSVVNISWEPGDDMPMMEQVPLLNVYIDPTADNIQSAPSIVVKWLMPKAQAMRFKHLRPILESEEFTGDTLIYSDEFDDTSQQRYSLKGSQTVDHEEEMVWVWQRWGPMDNDIIDNERKKKGRQEAVIWAVSSSRRKPIVAAVLKNPYKHGKRPFIELRYRFMPGRWYGLGVGEDVSDLQRYMNTTVNQRIDNAEIIQHKMFVYRKGSGIDPRMLIARPGGAIPVNDIDRDIKALEYTDIRQSSYKDEENIRLEAERVTNAFEIVRGGRAKGVETATEANIQAAGAGGAFSHIRRNIEHALEMMIEQMIALNQQYLTKDFVVRVTGTRDELKEIDNILQLPEQTRKDEKFRFIKVEGAKDIRGQFDIDVDIDNSAPVNKAVLMNFVLRTIELARQDPESGINLRELYGFLFDLQGMSGDRFFNQQPSQEELLQKMQLEAQAQETQQPTAPGERPAFGQDVENLVEQSESPRNVLR